MNKARYAVLAAAALLVASCAEDDYKVYDKNQKDSVFFNYLNSRETQDSVITYNFGYDIAHEHVVDIPVSLMGMPSEHARVIDIQPVADSTDMVEGTHYEIVRNEIEAGAVSDTVKIKLLRDNDPELQNRMFKLRIAIQTGNELRPTGQSTFTIKYSDIRATQRPKWWVNYTGSPLPAYTFENAQLFFKYFYDLAPKANKEIFDEIIDAYGDYFTKFDKDYGGPISMYDAFFIKYVLIPMYEDTKDQIEWPSGKPKIN